MNAALTTLTTVAATPRTGSAALWAGWTAASVAVAAAWWFTRDLPGWVTMVAIAFTEFYTLKLATVRGFAARSDGARLAGYLLAWPGMNARAFFDAGPVVRPTGGEWVWAGAKIGLGFALAWWAARGAPSAITPHVGLLGLILVVHFGGFHLAACAWRAGGVEAPPIMRAPIAATSLAELWGTRWNLAFADGARRFLVKPLARPLGARGAGLAVFAVSGLVHETVISLPARGGWGGPTVYFLFQAAGIAIERSAAGMRLGLGRGLRGRGWTLLVAVAPLPLLFHAPFFAHVFLPLFHVVTELFSP